MVCVSIRVWPLPGGLLPSQHRRWSIIFRVLPQQKNQRREREEEEKEIIDGHLRSLFERLFHKEAWTLTIEDFALRFDSCRAFLVLSSRERAVQPFVRSAISSFSNLNRASNGSPGLFYHVPLKKGQEDWRLRLNYTPDAIGCTWKRLLLNEQTNIERHMDRPKAVVGVIRGVA